MPNKIVLSRQPDHTDIFWVEEGMIWHAWQAPPKKNWQKYSIDIINQVGGGLHLNANISVISRNSNTWNVFWIANDGNLYTAEWHADKGWHYCSRINNETSKADPQAKLVAIARKPNVMDIFWVGIDGTLWNSCLNEEKAQESWSDNCKSITPPKSISPQGSLSAVARNQDGIEVCWMAEGSIFYTWWSENLEQEGWDHNHISKIEGALASNPKASLTTVSRCGSLDIIWVNGNGSIIRRCGDWQETLAEANTIDTNTSLNTYVLSDNRMLVSWVEKGAKIKNWLWHGENFGWESNAKIPEHDLEEKVSALTISLNQIKKVSTDKVVTISRKPGCLEIFWVEKDGSIWTKHWNETQGWMSEKRITKKGQANFESKLTVISRTSEQLDLFWIDCNGAVKSTWWNSHCNAGEWNENSVYEVIPPGLVNPKAAMAGVSHYSACMDIFLVAKDNSIWTKRWENGTWKNQYRIPETDSLHLQPAPNSSLSAVAQKNDLIEIFWINSKGRVCKASFGMPTQYSWPINSLTEENEASKVCLLSMTRSSGWSGQSKLVKWISGLTQTDLFWMTKGGALKNAFFWQRGGIGLFHNKEGSGTGEIISANEANFELTTAFSVISLRPNHLEIFGVDRTNRLKNFWWIQGNKWNRGDVPPFVIKERSQISSCVVNQEHSMVIWIGEDENLWCCEHKGGSWQQQPQMLTFHMSENIDHSHFIKALHFANRFNLENPECKENQELLHDEVDQLLGDKISRELWKRRDYEIVKPKEEWTAEDHENVNLTYFYPLVYHVGLESLDIKYNFLGKEREAYLKKDRRKIYNGINQYIFLPMRIKVFLEILIKLEKNIYNGFIPRVNRSLEEQRSKLISIATREILLDIKAYKALDLSYKLKADQDKITGDALGKASESLLNALTNLNEGEDFLYCSGYRYQGEKGNPGHAVYIRFSRYQNNIVISMDNLGDGFDKNNHKYRHTRQGVEDRKPHGVGCFRIEDFNRQSNLYNYLEGIVEANFESDKDALPKIYNKNDRYNILELSNKALLSNFEKQWLYSKSQTMGNCVIKNRFPTLKLSAMRADPEKYDDLYKFMRDCELQIVTLSTKRNFSKEIQESKVEKCNILSPSFYENEDNDNEETTAQLTL